MKPYYKVIISKRSIHTSSKGSIKSPIWVYDISNTLGNQQGLVKGAPFITKSDCTNILHINRNTVIAYLDKEKLFNNKWIFSSTVLSKQ